MKSNHQPSANRTMPLRVPLAVSLAGVSLALGLSGCAQETTGATAHPIVAESTTSSAADPLASYIEANRLAVETMVMERFSDIYSDFWVGAEGPGTLVYRYTFRTQLDAGQAQSGMATMEGALKTSASDVIIPEMRAAGIEDPAVKWIYRNADGTDIATLVVSD